MTTAYGYDDVNLSLIPSDAEYVFYYVDGDYKETSTVSAKFPKARLIGIAVDSADAADVLDVETGDASIADVFYWLKCKNSPEPSLTSLPSCPGKMIDLNV
jgi:hypothetical protein